MAANSLMEKLFFRKYPDTCGWGLVLYMLFNKF